MVSSPSQPCGAFMTDEPEDRQTLLPNDPALCVQHRLPGMCASVGVVQWWDSCFLSASKSLEKKRINFLALKAINPLPSYSAQPTCIKVRCRAFLMSARFARVGPASVKNWATKNLGEVLFKSGW